MDQRNFGAGAIGSSQEGTGGISDEDLDEVFVVLREQNAKADITCYKPVFLRRRILARMIATKTKMPSQYIKLLRGDPAEVRNLMDALSINVSEFFRDAYVWSRVGTILSRLVAEKAARGSRSIRIWSAGCSCGEEPYSIAILLKEALDKNGAHEFVASIYATDIDRDALDRGAAGVYPRQSLKNLPESGLRYFTNNGEHYSVSDVIKRYVKFRQSNVVNDPPLLYCDMIFCRNLMIYLSQESQKELISKFWLALNSGGYLVLGLSEVLGDDELSSFTAYDVKARIYRKAETLRPRRHC